MRGSGSHGELDYRKELKLGGWAVVWEKWMGQSIRCPAAVRELR